jgi:hypothetical protein
MSTAPGHAPMCARGAGDQERLIRSWDNPPRTRREVCPPLEVPVGLATTSQHAWRAVFIPDQFTNARLLHIRIRKLRKVQTFPAQLERVAVVNPLRWIFTRGGTHRDRRYFIGMLAGFGFGGLSLFVIPADWQLPATLFIYAPSLFLSVCLEDWLLSRRHRRDNES